MSKYVILCVDDEKIVLDSLRDQLYDQLGYQYRYEVAESAEEAWEILNESCSEDTEVKVIICDWLMPEIKGDDFLIAVHKKFPEIVKIILTGEADQKAINRAKKNADLCFHFRKPWNTKKLIGAIQSEIGN